MLCNDPMLWAMMAVDLQIQQYNPVGRPVTFGRIATRGESMGNFFKGWRRKAGLVLLVIALAIAGAWGRSLMIRDELFVPRKDALQVVASSCGTVRWARATPRPFYFEDLTSMRSYSKGFADDRERFENQDADHYWSWCTVEWRWGGIGFDFGAGRDSSTGMQLERWAIPYWSLVSPLPMLSAYLILWKPRKRAAP